MTDPIEAAFETERSRLAGIQTKARWGHRGLQVASILAVVANPIAVVVAAANPGTAWVWAGVAMTALLSFAAAAASTFQPQEEWARAAAARTRLEMEWLLFSGRARDYAGLSKKAATRLFTERLTDLRLADLRAWAASVADQKIATMQRDVRAAVESMHSGDRARVRLEEQASEDDPGVEHEEHEERERRATTE